MSRVDRSANRRVELAAVIAVLQIISWLNIGALDPNLGLGIPFVPSLVISDIDSIPSSSGRSSP